MGLSERDRDEHEAWVSYQWKISIGSCEECGRLGMSYVHDTSGSYWSMERPAIGEYLGGSVDSTKEKGRKVCEAEVCYFQIMDYSILSEVQSICYRKPIENGGIQ